MHPCAWRKGCDEWALGEDHYCPYHLKRRVPPEPDGHTRDPFSSEAIAIATAEKLLGITLAQLDGHAQPEAHRVRPRPRS